MQALPPPKNVRLSASTKKAFSTKLLPTKESISTHRLAYTPGIFASVTLSGSCFKNRSGFHSLASGPQINGSVLMAFIPTNTVVSLGMKSSKTCELPTVAGVSSGTTASLRQLVDYVRWEDETVGE